MTYRYPGKESGGRELTRLTVTRDTPTATYNADHMVVTYDRDNDSDI